MPRHLIAVRLLQWLDADGTREALVGDLIEEIGLGRSRFWLWQQILAWGGLAAGRRARTCAETAHLMALAPSLLLVGALWIAPLANVLATWAVCYFVSGLLSLLGDLISSRTDDWRSLKSVRTTMER